MKLDPDLEPLAVLAAVLVDGGQARPAPAALVRRHALGPLAFTHGLAEHRGDYVISSIQAEQQRAIATEATTALVAAGIPVALLKGISYGAWLYDDPGERPMTDVDLLVPSADFTQGVAVMRRLGYWHTGPGAQLSPLHHGITLKRAHAAVDLHRSPAQIGRIAFDLAGVWQRTAPAPWIPGAQRLDLVDEILFHFANLTRHELVAPLMSYVDAGRLLRRLDGPGWSRLLERATQWRFRRVLEACLEVVEHALGWRSAAPRWWLPSKNEVLRGELPPRAVQIARKLLLIEGPRELAAFSLAIADGWRAARAEPRSP